ncbi:serine/threonine-protein kinase PknK [Haliangium sp.]|uniref:serine/threonine-protein kinase n=1 Tax=Haliangium sp. TaxID=2663208 RepID=UPI003D0D2E3A
MQSGTVLAGRYVVESLAGSGGMSTVYKAHDLAGRAVALKVLKLHAGHQAARFQRETNLLHKLRHPAIVGYIDSGYIEDTGQYFLVLEWLDGVDLHALLDQGQLDIVSALRLAVRIAEALGFAHERGVVHRDVKPENIFLPGAEIERAKLLDFGIARWAEAIEALTRTGARFGTPAYMSPEQVRGDRNLDARADVFSLGCVLFECITGEPAFAANDPMAVFGKILFDDSPRISHLVPKVSDAVEGLVLRMMARDPADRPGSGDEVAAELRRLLTQVASSTPERRPRTTTKQQTLTDLEQRMVSVVVAMIDPAAYQAAVLLATAPPEVSEGPVPTTTAPDGDDGDEPWDTVADAGDGDGDGRGPLLLDGALRQELESLGARVGVLRSGLLVAVLEHRGVSIHTTAGDQAANAARGALVLQRRFSRAPVALATGRAVLHRTRLVGEVIDQAVALLDGPERTSAERRAPRIDELTAGLLGGRFTVEGTAEDGLRLAEAPVSETAARTRKDRSPFVGRHSELATLLIALEECTDERTARVCMISGPPGFGKSRLCEEFLSHLRRIGAEVGENIEVWMAHGDPMRAGSPLRLFAEAVRSAAGIVESEPLERKRKKLAHRVGRYLPPADARRVALFLGELMRLPSPDDDLQLRAARQDPKLMGDQVRRACADLLDAETAVHSLVVVLEDLHWGDRATLEVLDLALRNLVDRPLLVLALGRPETSDLFPGMWAGHNVTELRLSRLSRRAAEKLVRAGLGGEVEAQRVAELVERGDGNPFYLEELVRRVEAGHSTMPETVMAMVQGRLSALDPQARRVLRAASVFGRTFWFGGVTALAGDGLPVARWLDTLVELGLVIRSPTSRFPDEAEYSFRHALISEGAYGMLTAEDRLLGHRLAGAWLTRVGEGEARVLAEHFERGDALPMALPHYLQAAEDALDSSDFDAAVAMAERGIACGASGVELGALRRVQMEERIWRGNEAEVVALGIEVMSLLRRGDRAWFDVAGEMAITYGKRGELEQLEALASDLLAMGDEAHDPTGRWIAIAKAGSVLFVSGLRALADRLLSTLEAEVGDLERVDPTVAANIHMARAFRADTGHGDPTAMLINTERCASCFEAIGNVRQACLHRTNVGYAKLELGLVDEAVADLRSALAIAERTAIDLAANTARKNLMLAYTYQGALSEARALGRHVCTWFEERKDARELALSRLYLANVLLMDDDLQGAESETRATLETLSSASPLRAFALALLARIHLIRDERDQALSVAREAYQLLESPRGVESGESLVRLVWAETLAAVGEHEQMRIAIAEAQTVLRDRADKIGRPDWRQRFLLDIPDHARTMDLARRWLD